MERRRLTGGDRGSCLGRVLKVLLFTAIVAGGVLWAFPSLRTDVEDAIRDGEGRGPAGENVVIDEDAAHEDIDAVTCTESMFGMMAIVELTNRGDQPASYVVGVAFESPDGDRQLDTSSAHVSGLEPGQAVAEEASAFEDAPADGFRCRVRSFVRTP